VRWAPARGCGPDRLAIRPYPSGLEERIRLRDGRGCLLRPIRPEDEPAHAAFLQRLDPEDVYFRFFTPLRRMPHSELARYTQIDYDREMAFIATAAAPDAAGDAPAETLGVVRAISDPDNVSAEFAIVVRSDLKGQGLGRALMEKIIGYCRSRGTRELAGQVLPANRAMLDLAREFGFASRLDADLGVVLLRLPL
jgi:acetyltransferase